MENNINTKKSKISLSNVVHDNRFVALFSLLIAFALWTWIAMEKSPEVQTVITDVPVQINLENTIPKQLGLEIFGESEFKVDVTVRGKKYIVSALDSNDIQVVANTNRVDSAGLWTLQLKVTPKDDSDDFNISSTSSTHVEVYFDTYKEIEVALEGIVDTKLDSYVPIDCLAGDVVLSKNTVLLSGPATEINRVSGVSATAVVDTVLEKTTTFDTKIVIKTTDGTELEYTKINTDDGNITMAVPVLKVVTLPTTVEFKNAPSYFINNPLKYSIYPSSVKVAIPVDAIETTKEFVVNTIDFADITNSYNTIYVNTDAIVSYKIMDESVKNFRININASEFSLKTLSIPFSAIKIKNDREDFDVSLNTNKDIAVTLVGPKSDIDAITAESLSIEVDTTGQTIVSNTQTLQGRVLVASDYSCWAIGKYDIKVLVKSK